MQILCFFFFKKNRVNSIFHFSLLCELFQIFPFHWKTLHKICECAHAHKGHAGRTDGSNEIRNRDCVTRFLYRDNEMDGESAKRKGEEKCEGKKEKNDQPLLPALMRSCSERRRDGRARPFCAHLNALLCTHAQWI